MPLDRCILDMDFSQNYNYGSVYRHAIQSAHWKNKTVTIFCAIFRYLCPEKFNNMKLRLLKGDEVSYKHPTTGNLHYGVVVEDSKLKGDDVVEGSTDVGEGSRDVGEGSRDVGEGSRDVGEGSTDVGEGSTDVGEGSRDVGEGSRDVGEEGTTEVVAVRLQYDTVDGESPGYVHHFPRGALHRRVMKTIPITAISDDKHHDTTFVQHFLKVEFYKWFKEMGDQLRHLKYLSIHSDGAASHFKNKDSIGFQLDLRDQFGFTTVSWSFGCPGHGKGVWDGIGGIIKNTTTMYLIRSRETVNTADKIFRIICMLFSPIPNNEVDPMLIRRRNNLKTETWYFCFVKAEDTNVLRPNPNQETFVTRIDLKGTVDGEQASTGWYSGSGTRSMFYYEAVGCGDQLAYRTFACNCVRCMGGGKSWLQSPRVMKKINKTTTLSTIIPNCEDCILHEPWQYQHLQIKVKNNKNNPHIQAEKASKEKKKDDKKAAEKDAARLVTEAEQAKKEADERLRVIAVATNLAEEEARNTIANNPTRNTRIRYAADEDVHCSCGCEQSYTRAEMTTCHDGRCNNLVNRLCPRAIAS